MAWPNSRSASSPNNKTMEKGRRAMLTKIGDFGRPDHPIEMGREFKGIVRDALTTGTGFVLDGVETKGIATSQVLEFKQTGNVYLIKTRNSVYLLQPL